MKHPMKHPIKGSHKTIHTKRPELIGEFRSFTIYERSSCRPSVGLFAQCETLVSDNRRLFVCLVDEVGDRLFLAHYGLSQQRVLLEELAHLAFGDLLKDGFGLVGVLGVLLHRLDGDLALMLHNLCGAVRLRDRNGSHGRSLHGHGVCDLGVVGKDTILENGNSFYELLDLGFGKCRFALATKKGTDFYSGYNTKTIATKYPNVTRAFFDDKNMDVRIIKIEGSVELAPLVGLSDGIVDIVETGSTLKANGLEVIEWVTEISARLIANTASLKLRKAEIEELQKKLEAVTK